MYLVRPSVVNLTYTKGLRSCRSTNRQFGVFALLDKRDSNSFLVANFEKDADPQSNTTKTMLLTKNYHSKDDEIFIIANCKIKLENKRHLWYTQIVFPTKENKGV